MDQEKRQSLVQMVQQLLASEHRVCAVCDEIVLNRQEVCNFEVSELPSSFFGRLQSPSGNNPLIPKLDGLLKKQYDVSELFSDKRFEEILLSPRAFSSEIRAAGEPQVPVCKRCVDSLKRATEKPPKLAIANGFYVGVLPKHLQNVSRADVKACTIAQVSDQVGYACGRAGYVKVLTGTSKKLPQRRAKGHSFSTFQDVGIVGQQLPLSIGELPIRVLLSGAYTRQQRLEFLKDEVLHRDLVRNLLVFCRDRNVVYTSFRSSLSDEKLDASPQLADYPVCAVPAALVQKCQDSLELEKVQETKYDTGGENLVTADDSGTMIPMTTTIHVLNNSSTSETEENLQMLNKAANDR
jgi:hypothetical protein